MTTAVMTTPNAMKTPIQSGQVSPDSITIEMILALLKQLRPDQLREVFQFVQFLEYKAELKPDLSEEEALWAAAQVHEAYKVAHPEDKPTICRTDEELRTLLAEL